ncbi:MAG: Bor/Iss family lipoprotein [Gemmatimonadaceae bacterium]
MIDKQWAHSFIDGLVPPDVISTASKCPHGVARVETQHSFLNEVAATGTMAAGTPTVSGTDFEIVLAHAIQASAESGAAVNALTTR